MSIVGKWKLDAVMSFGSDEYMSVEEFVNELPSYINKDDAEEVAHEKEQRMMQAESVLDITKEGKIESMMPIPSKYSKEEIDKAVASGDVELRGDMMLVDVNEWKEEDGKFFFSSGTVSFGDGDPETSWDELELVDGKLVFNGMRYVRV